MDQDQLSWLSDFYFRSEYHVSSSTRGFCLVPRLLTLAEIISDNLMLEQETEVLLAEIKKGAAR